VEYGGHFSRKVSLGHYDRLRILTTKSVFQPQSLYSYHQLTWHVPDSQNRDVAFQPKRETDAKSPAFIARETLNCLSPCTLTGHTQQPRNLLSLPQEADDTWYPLLCSAAAAACVATRMLTRSPAPRVSPMQPPLKPLVRVVCAATGCCAWQNRL